MHKSFLILITMLLLVGCSGHHRELDIAKKERLVKELFTSSPQCGIYIEKLSNPRLEDDDVDDIFHEALAAHCVKKDV